jgi:thiol-disulfide isomerase/thioredoxin
MEKIIIIFFCFFLIYLFLNNLFSKNNFQNISNNQLNNNITNNIKIYYFNASWCYHCQQFKPIWNNFVNSISDSDHITPINLNCDNNKDNNDLINKYNIEGFPTIIIVYNDNKYVKYTGPKTVNDLRKFLNLNKTSKISIYNFNTDTCGYSVKFQPVWNQFTNSINNPNIKIYDIKCDNPKNNNLCNKFNIEGYPTVIKEDHITNNIQYYNGPRTLDGLMNFTK